MVAAGLPDRVARRAVSVLIGDSEVALCFHRVGDDAARGRMLMPELCHDAHAVDELLGWLDEADGMVTMAFDDGYADAADFVMDRAPRHPHVRWQFFVCPQKTIDRYGFPWDDWLDRSDAGDVDEFLADWRTALTSGDAVALGQPGGADREHARLATIDECQRLAELDNVDLGNHLDRHLPSSWLSPEELVAEIQRSHERFVEAFGPTDHIALPFGTMPYVTADNLRVALETFDGYVWTIGSSPAVADERVLPRFSMRSTDGSAKATVLVIAIRLRLSRLRGRR